MDSVLYQWFEPQDIVESIVSVETGSMLDVERIGYRFLLSCPDGKHLVEQQAYYKVNSDGQICWMRAMCSGFRPIEGAESDANLP